MADLITQAGRLMSLKTPAGDDVLCIENANITERISKPFVMQFDLLAEKSKARRSIIRSYWAKTSRSPSSLPGKQEAIFFRHGEPL